jgi:hypothetical protein
MKQLLMTITITCALASSAFGGEIPSVGASAPSGSIAGTNTTSPGEIPSVGKSELSSDALTALLSVLSFLTR